MFSFSSYLARRHELQRTQSALHVGDIRLQLIEGGSETGFDFRRLGPRRAIGSDFIERLLRHGGGWNAVVVKEVSMPAKAE